MAEGGKGSESCCLVGYLEVNWQKPIKDVRSVLDLDGDGDFDHNDVKVSEFPCQGLEF